MKKDVAVQQSEPDYAMVEKVVMEGDLSQLTPKERMTYYRSVCDSLGLNPLTKPFAYLRLSRGLVLYALRDATDQLRSIRGISIEITSRDLVGDLYLVTAKATDSKNRTDEAIGAVHIGNLKGDAAANAIMKAETKAKRRVTLSIAGLGFLDESEVSSIPGAEVEQFEPLNEGQLKMLKQKVVDTGADEHAFCEWLGLASLNELPAAEFMRALAALDAAKSKREEKRKSGEATVDSRQP